MLTQRKNLFIVCMLFIVWFLASGSFSQEAEPKYTATTISDPQIPVGDLELLLKPLTKSELTVEAEAWRQLLKSKVSQISEAEILMRQKSREIDQKEEEIEKKINRLKKRKNKQRKKSKSRPKLKKKYRKKSRLSIKQNQRLKR